MPLPVPSPDLVAVLWGRAVRAISDALSAVPVEPMPAERTSTSQGAPAPYSFSSPRRTP
jgi:hypothetical protein